MVNELCFHDRNCAYCLACMLQHGQHDAPSVPSSKRRGNVHKERTSAASSTTRNKIAEDPARDSTSLGSPSGLAVPRGNRDDGVGGNPDAGEGAQHQLDPAAQGELQIDVIPTSSSKRCHSASVALRGTVDVEVRSQ